jgi:protein-tyrosine phosphatase
MLRHAAEQGITDVVNTVHYQHPKVETEDISLERIQKEVKTLQTELDNNKIPIKLHCGAEVFFLPNLLEIKDDPLATFLHGKYMLIEFQVHQLPRIQKQQLFDLKMAGVTPIIAHPERYKQVQENTNIVAEWLRAGCLIQIDAGSPLGYLGSQSQVASERIIKNGWCQVLGSDSHDEKRRNFCLAESVDCVRNWIGDHVDSMVKENPKLILKGDKIEVKIEYETSESSHFFSHIKTRFGLS